MSHIVKGKVKMNNADAVRRALEQVCREHAEARLATNAKPRYYFSGRGGREAPVCDFVLQLPGMYDLGVKLDSVTGMYEVVADNELLGGQYTSDGYGRGKPGRKIVGDDGRVFYQAYQVEAAKLLAESQGFAYEVFHQEDGSVDVLVEVPDGDY